MDYLRCLGVYIMTPVSSTPMLGWMGGALTPAAQMGAPQYTGYVVSVLDTEGHTHFVVVRAPNLDVEISILHCRVIYRENRPCVSVSAIGVLSHLSCRCISEVPVHPTAARTLLGRPTHAVIGDAGPPQALLLMPSDSM